MSQASTRKPVPRRRVETPERTLMITKALLFRFESQTDEDTMDTFLEDLATDVSWEKTTQAWFGIRYMRGEFGMYSCYDDEAGREAHLQGDSARKVFAAEHRLMTA